jgi:exonuclease SbcC
MRPVRLELEGFTSFKERLALDFDGLDLFAITGPTGAGKSSLIDAIVFALYGQVPRVGREYKQLISHGAERLSVKLDFEVADQRYRVARTARASGNPQTVLERETKKGYEPLAGRVKEIEDAIERIVGLDYDAFTRSVVLPQGQFDAFLKGEPKERRKILVALLNLGVYEEMHQIANRRAIDARREAEFVANQLAGDFQGATEEALRERTAELAEARRARDAASTALAATTEGLAIARRAGASRRDLEQVRRDVVAEQARLDKAAATVAASGERTATLARRRAEIETALRAAPFDPARRETVAAARPLVDRLAALEPRRDRIERAASEQAAALGRATVALAAAEARQPALERAAGEAAARSEEARAARDDVHRRHAAHAIRRHLAPGQPCPVCEREVAALPGAAPEPALRGADEALRRAEKAEAAARDAIGALRIETEQARGEVRRLTGQEAEILQRTAELRSEAAAVHDALAGAGFRPLDWADPGALGARLQAEARALDAARARREAVEADLRTLEREAGDLAAAEAAARAQLESAGQRVADLDGRLQGCVAALEAAEAELAALASRQEWRLAPGADPLGGLEREHASVQARHAEAQTRAVRLEALLERLQKDIARAAELAERKKALEEKAALASTLAQHLRADQLLGYIQEEALRLLAEDGSRRLVALSHGRYSLVVDDQEFAVVDHWNADSRRSVKTLSGGETFLASLALALALAESLAELAAEGRAGEALESLFLDEGFGTLDPDALGQVVQALDALHGGERLVGVVTHIPELAAQLPARVEVARADGTAVVSVS